jgi:hypothetical protein
MTFGASKLLLWWETSGVERSWSAWAQASKKSESLTRIQYRYKCEKCGHIEGTLRSATDDDAGRITSTSFNCYKCDHQQQVAMLE